MEIGKSQFDGLVEVIGRYSKPIAASVQYFAKKVTSKFSVEIAAVFLFMGVWYMEGYCSPWRLVPIL